MSRAKDLLQILEAELDTEIEKEMDDEDTDTEMDDEEEFEDEEDEDCFEHVLDVSNKSKEWIKELVDKVMDKCPDVTIDHDGDTLTICCYNQEQDQVEEIINAMNGGKQEPTEDIKDEDDEGDEKEEETEIDDNDDSEEEEEVEGEPTQSKDGLVDEAQIHNKRAEEWLRTTKQAGTAPDVFWTDGDYGYSYNTVIAKKEGNKLFLNRTKYSKTTSNLIRAIESSAEDLGMTIINKEEDYFNTSMPIKFGGGADVSRGTIKEDGTLEHDMNDTREHTLFQGEPSQPVSPISKTSESAIKIMERFMVNTTTTFGDNINENSLKDSSANSLMNYFSK